MVCVFRKNVTLSYISRTVRERRSMKALSVNLTKVRNRNLTFGT